MKHLFLLLLPFMFSAFCNGQAKSPMPPDSLRMQEPMARHPNIQKTQGGNVYINTHCGLADKAGNLWFGTTGEGVYRYDGTSFTHFTEKEGLSSNTVWSVLEDKAGNLWFGTDGGLCRYDGTVLSPIPIVVADDLYDPFAENAVWSMLQDRSGKLWFGTSNGVYCYDGTSFTRFLESDGLVNADGVHLKMVDCILEDKTGNLFRLVHGRRQRRQHLDRYEKYRIVPLRWKNVYVLFGRIEMKATATHFDSTLVFYVSQFF